MSPEDILIWPCGTWCQRYQLNLNFMALPGTFEVLKSGSYEWRIFLNDPELWLS